MEVTGSLQIVCPIRGQLKVNKRSKDGLSASEEFYRVEAIKYCYPKVILGDLNSQVELVNRIVSTIMNETKEGDRL